MTHQNDARIKVTIYQDVVIRGPGYIREIDIPMGFSRIFFEYTCAVLTISSDLI